MTQERDKRFEEETKPVEKGDRPKGPPDRSNEESNKGLRQRQGQGQPQERR